MSQRRRNASRARSTLQPGPRRQRRPSRRWSQSTNDAPGQVALERVRNTTPIGSYVLPLGSASLVRSLSARCPWTGQAAISSCRVRGANMILDGICTWWGLRQRLVDHTAGSGHWLGVASAAVAATSTSKFAGATSQRKHARLTPGARSADMGWSIPSPDRRSRGLVTERASLSQLRSAEAGGKKAHAPR